MTDFVDDAHDHTRDQLWTTQTPAHNVYSSSKLSYMLASVEQVNLDALPNISEEIIVEIDSTDARREESGIGDRVMLMARLKGWLKQMFSRGMSMPSSSASHDAKADSAHSASRSWWDWLKAKLRDLLVEVRHSFLGLRSNLAHVSSVFFIISVILASAEM